MRRFYPPRKPRPGRGEGGMGMEGMDEGFFVVFFEGLEICRNG